MLNPLNLPLTKANYTKIQPVQQDLASVLNRALRKSADSSAMDIRTDTTKLIKNKTRN